MSVAGLAGFLIACFAAAASGAVFRPGPWYKALRKPVWTPPDWLFAPAWTVLFLLIAVAGWMVWRTHGFGGAALALAVYFVHLALNAAWSAIFFGLRRPDLAFVEVVLLWLSILATIVLFLPLERAAAMMLLPYLAWVSFAAALNLAIWRLNRGDTANLRA